MADLYADLAALADEWEHDYPSPSASCAREPDEWWRELRAKLAAHTPPSETATEARCGSREAHAAHSMPCDSGCQPDWHRDGCAIYGDCPGLDLPSPPSSSDADRGAAPSELQPAPTLEVGDRGAGLSEDEPDDAGPECETCGKTTCPDADLPSFSAPQRCVYGPIYQVLRDTKDCDYGCGRDLTNREVRMLVVPAVELMIAARERDSASTRGLQRDMFLAAVKKADRERARADGLVAAVEALCVLWDELTKGPSPTTLAIRAAIERAR